MDSPLQPDQSCEEKLIRVTKGSLDQAPSAGVSHVANYVGETVIQMQELFL